MTDETSTDSHAAPVSERARIEAPHTSRHIDALPILYLAGFLILAGSLVYLWRHPTLPSGVTQQAERVDTLRQEADARRAELRSLSERLARLESRPAAAAPDLTPVEARVKALEDRPAPPAADLGPVDRRVAALESRPPVNTSLLDARLSAVEGRAPVDLRPLEGRVAAVEGRRPVDLGPLEARVGAVENRRPVDLGPLENRVGALEPRLASVETEAKGTAAGLARIDERAARAGKLIAATAALEAGQKLGDLPGAPPAVARFAQVAPPTESALRLSFNAAADAAHRASQPAIAGDKPLLDRMWTRAQQSVTVRQGDRVLVGDPIAGVVAGSRQALDAGDLAGAVKALDGLAGPARAAMEEWIGRAQSVLDARAGLAAMASR